MEVSGQLHAQAALHPGKNPQYRLNTRSCGPLRHYGRFGEGKMFVPAGIQTPVRAARSLVSLDYEIAGG
jgi:hypothetical protein